MRLRQQRLRDRQHGRKVDALELRRVHGVTAQLGAQDRLHEGPQQQAVRGRDEIDRRPHDVGPPDPALVEQGRQRLRPEPVEPGPQRRVGVVRHLRLQADQVPDGGERLHVGPLQEQLPRERRPVQRAPSQNLGHDPILRKKGDSGRSG